MSTFVGSHYQAADLLINDSFNSSNKSNTLSLESGYNYETIAISPNSCIMVAVNEIGEAQVISLISYTVIYTHKFSETVRCVQFSPDGKYFALARGTTGTDVKMFDLCKYVHLCNSFQ